MKLSFILTVDTDNGAFTVVNQETGEEQSCKVAVVKKEAAPKKKKANESSEPQLILEDNKYTLNSAAVELMGVEPEARLCIKYKKVGKASIPVVGTEEAFGVKGGNRLTKSYTVACRGKANEELSTYGKVFTLSENTDGSGTFILTGDKAPAPKLPELEDEAIDIEDQNIMDDIKKIGDSIDAEDVEEVSADELDSFLNEFE